MLKINCSWKNTYNFEIQIQPWLLYNHLSGSYLCVLKGEIWSRLIKFIFLLSLRHVEEYFQNMFILFLRRYFSYTYKLQVLWVRT